MKKVVICLMSASMAFAKQPQVKKSKNKVHYFEIIDIVDSDYGDLIWGVCDESNYPYASEFESIEIPELK